MSVKNHLTKRIIKRIIKNYLNRIEKIAQRRAGFSCETKASTPLSGGDAFFLLTIRILPEQGLSFRNYLRSTAEDPGARSLGIRAETGILFKQF